jgi:predicted transcriptional regulator
MPTTIQVSDEIKTSLERMKLFDKDSYNDVIERILEDHMELNEATKKEVEAARRRVKQGKYVRMEDVAKKFGV